MVWEKTILKSLLQSVQNFLVRGRASIQFFNKFTRNCVYFSFLVQSNAHIVVFNESYHSLKRYFFSHVVIEKLPFQKFSSRLLGLKLRRLGFKLSCMNNNLFLAGCKESPFIFHTVQRSKVSVIHRSDMGYRPKLVPFPGLRKGTVSRDFFSSGFFHESVFFLKVWWLDATLFVYF